MGFNMYGMGIHTKAKNCGLGCLKNTWGSSKSHLLLACTKDSYIVMGMQKLHTYVHTMQLALKSGLKSGGESAIFAERLHCLISTVFLDFFWKLLSTLTRYKLLQLYFFPNLAQVNSILFCRVGYIHLGHLKHDNNRFARNRWEK